MKIRYLRKQLVNHTFKPKKENSITHKPFNKKTSKSLIDFIFNIHNPFLQ